MKKLKFKYARAENFLCYGPAGVEINFEALGPIVKITAVNLDQGNTSSNGSGKSSWLEPPVYALFGKTVKKPKKLGHSDLINNQAGKKLSVEFRWDDYRVVRTREPNSLRLWRSADGVWDKTTEITKGGMPATQELIESVVGLTYETFVNVYVFSDDPSTAFLESDQPTKREIVENLLSLGKYRLYNETAKAKVKAAKDQVAALVRDYERAVAEVDAGKARLLRVEDQEAKWRQDRKTELAQLLNQIKAKRDALGKTDDGAALAKYQEAQEQIADLTAGLPALEERQQKLKEALDGARAKTDKVAGDLAAATALVGGRHAAVGGHQATLNMHDKVINDIKKKLGADCPYCERPVDEARFAARLRAAEEGCKAEEPRLREAQEQLAAAEAALGNLATVKKKLDAGVADCTAKAAQVARQISDAQAAISQLGRVKEPQASVDERLLLEQIEELKRRAVAKKAEGDGPSPLADLVRAAVAEVADRERAVQEKKAEAAGAQERVPYYEFWVKAFGDGGIRKYVIDGIVPTLNASVAHWLRLLIDNKIRLEFDNQLQETIDRYPFAGKPYVYHGMSGGQRRRLNLAVSQAFAHVMMLNSGAAPSVVFLDEVTMNMDETGVDGIYRMICALAADKQVFVIDHNPLLLQMLDGCDAVRLEMKDGISRRV